jgi:anti-anti-sigma regulatory factor
MAAKKKNPGNKNQAKIEGAMCIYEAAGLHKQMMKILKKPEQCVLDLGGVTECDASGAQILISAGLAAAESGHVLRVSRISPALVDAFTRIGLHMDEVLHLEKESSDG